jgi:hypothetical protein
MVVVVGAGGLTGVEVLAEVVEVFDVVVGGTGVDTPSEPKKLSENRRKQHHQNPRTRRTNISIIII